MKRCMWCYWDLNTIPNHVEITEREIEGRWCNGNCAVSYYNTFKPTKPLMRTTRAIQDALHQPSDVMWQPAPIPHGYEWWVSGGKTREEFLAECKIIHMYKPPDMTSELSKYNKHSLKSIFDMLVSNEEAEKKRKRDEDEQVVKDVTPVMKKRKKKKKLRVPSSEKKK